MTVRAAALAARIEQGATELAAFAESLTDQEWRHVVHPDGRTVGVVIHHVASVYPIEVDLAKAIGSGKAVSEVTWAVVRDLNAGHARDNAGITKADALSALRNNARMAAAAVREFTDAQLDTAAAFGLAYDAPVTAQFVIEDHAVRHSWHHRAKIKASLGR
jgi:hypothetical protein